jgi:phenylpyruvate tautomerase PptA (4-oxalocrotonate tautomerase family)
MARYLIQVPRDSLSEGRKAEIAMAITATHRAITGDDAISVEIAITEIDAGCFFAGGRLIECDHIFVHGYLPDGASGDLRGELRDRLSADITKAADFDADSTWVTISPL